MRSYDMSQSFYDRHLYIPTRYSTPTQNEHLAPDATAKVKNIQDS
jgi:hypothetical protein